MREMEDDMTPEETPQDAPGGPEGDPTPDEPAIEPEAQDGDASPAPEGDTTTEAGEVAPESLPVEPVGDLVEAESPGDVPEAGGELTAAFPVAGGDPEGDRHAAAPVDAPAPSAVEVAEIEDPEPTEMELAFSDITRANEKVRKAKEYLEKCQGRVKTAKEEEKEAENRLELAWKELSETIDESDRFPLIHYGKNKPTRAKPAPAKVVDPKPGPTVPQLVETATEIRVIEVPAGVNGLQPWRAARLDSLGIPSAVLRKLADSNYHTVGDVYNLTSRKDMSLQDIKGIGERAENQILDALLKFWADNPQYAEDRDKATAKPEDTPADNPPAEIAEAPADPAQEHVSEPAAEVEPEAAPEDKPEQKPKKSRKKKDA